MATIWLMMGELQISLEVVHEAIGREGRGVLSASEASLGGVAGRVCSENKANVLRS